MIFLKKEKVDEDVEKIRQYTLTPEQLQQSIAKKEKEKREIKEKSEDITFKDVVAMTIAIIELILPYFLICIATMVLVFLFFWWMGMH
ncbi:MAG: hypothetical protein IKR11_03745 [Solobacterium sp.]|nr:hypothetical protein [Solobacterium sp.]